MNNRRFRNRVTVIALLCFFIFSMISLSVSIYMDYKMVQRETEEWLMSQVAAFSAEMNQELVKRIRISETVQNYVEVTFDIETYNDHVTYVDDYIEEIDGFIYEIAKDYELSWIYFDPTIDGITRGRWYWDLDRDGVPEMVPDLEPDRLNDTENNDWYYGPVKSGKSEWTDIYPSTTFKDGTLFVTYSTPIYKEQQMIGVTGSDLYFNSIIEDFRKFTEESAGDVILMNSDLEFMIHPVFDSSINLYDLYENIDGSIVEQIEEGSEGIINYELEDGNQYVLAFSKLVNGWTIAIVQNRNVILSDLMDMLIFNASLFGFGILVAGIIVYSLLNKVTSGLYSMVDVVLDISNGNYDAEGLKIFKDDSSEIGEMARTIDKMREQQKVSLVELQSYKDSLMEKIEDRTKDLENTNLELEISLDELQTTQNQLIQSSKAELINHFLKEIVVRLNIPVNEVASYLDDIDLGKSNDNEMKALIEKSNEKLEGIKSVMLGLQKLPDSLKSSERESFNIVTSIKESIQIFYSDYKVSDLDIVVEGDESLKINAQIKIFEDAIMNLLKYGYFYSLKDHSDKQMKIRVVTRMRELVIHYEDSSLTSFSKFNEVLFEPFGIDQAEYSGTGLEMYLFKNLIYIGMNGEVRSFERDNNSLAIVVTLRDWEV